MVWGQGSRADDLLELPESHESAESSVGQQLGGCQMRFCRCAAVMAIALAVGTVGIVGSVASASSSSLSPKLLAVDQMPKGWIILPTYGNKRLGCLATIL